jgi:hypothetical protein
MVKNYEILQKYSQEPKLQVYIKFMYFSTQYFEKILIIEIKLRRKSRF